MIKKLKKVLINFKVKLNIISFTFIKKIDWLKLFINFKIIKVNHYKIFL